MTGKIIIYKLWYKEGNTVRWQYEYLQENIVQQQLQEAVNTL